MLLSQDNGNKTQNLNPQPNDSSNLIFLTQKRLFNTNPFEITKEANNTYDANLDSKNKKIELNKVSNSQSEKKKDLSQNQNLFKKYYTTTTTISTNLKNDDFNSTQFQDFGSKNSSNSIDPTYIKSTFDQFNKTATSSSTMNQTTNNNNVRDNISNKMLENTMVNVVSNSNNTSQDKFALSPLNGTEVAPLFSKFVSNEDTSGSVKFGYSSPPALSRNNASSQSNE
ncbi:uncharacterized protein cubi_01812 [Cryptosporidium ubiquitum]|uniref:Uncharacterized protein n=1 Tax=Cryptosporidium ubiquitum TaxID=857276 RepID=A0A1J4MAT0_9CRYT|nr:uncharacterized protein cubi_01812 [Cryptosporidium ubiquitum]OII71337.1 hypothetical protein cubi_01812 [Cryptosporidium ubiquitum]